LGLLDVFFGRELQQIKQSQERIMTTQLELAQQLTAIGNQIAKVSAESSATLQKVADLEAALTNASNVTPELQAAFDAVKAQVQLVDDLVPDSP
jgi:chromosome segregation ATPase